MSVYERISETRNSYNFTCSKNSSLYKTTLRGLSFSCSIVESHYLAAIANSSETLYNNLIESIFGIEFLKLSMYIYSNGMICNYIVPISDFVKYRIKRT